MKAVEIDRPYSINIIEKKKPVIEYEKQVLIKVKSVGICGSDVHIYHGTNPLATYPRVIGHEFAGEIVEIGDGVSKIHLGDKVTVEPIIYCGECYACCNQQPNVCEKLEVLGVHRDGGMQEYVLTSEDKVHLLPADISWEEACLIEPFTIGAQSTSRAKIKKGDDVWVIGAGPIGMTIVQNAKNYGARVIVTDIDDERLKATKKQGADEIINVAKTALKEEMMKITNNCGPNVTIDAACLKQTVEQAIELTSPAGRVVVLGFDSTPCDIAPLYITKKQLEILGSRLQYQKFPYVIEEYSKGKLDLSALITHTFSVKDIQKAFDAVLNPKEKTNKVVILFD